MTRYRTIVADPPWDYSGVTFRKGRGHRETYQNQPIPYECMTVDEIAASVKNLETAPGASTSVGEEQLPTGGTDESILGTSSASSTPSRCPTCGSDDPAKPWGIPSDHLPSLSVRMCDDIAWHNHRGGHTKTTEGDGP